MSNLHRLKAARTSLQSKTRSLLASAVLVEAGIRHVRRGRRLSVRLRLPGVGGARRGYSRQGAIFYDLQSQLESLGYIRLALTGGRQI